ncbi:MAG: D-alanyl-D-alanine carboxypeptidase [Bacillales bacterium]|nr:D-alanyl-D-alanine carboxypeptidase [Bacillales bacterium]
MKNAIFIFISLIFTFIPSFNHSNVNCILINERENAIDTNQIIDDVDEQISLHGNYYISLEIESGKVITSKNEHEKCFPASMTKMMGMYLILEEIHNSKISWDDEVICSSYASKMGGTQIYLEPNEKMRLEDLFKAVAINSSNDAIVCLGEHCFGTNEAFVKAMNNKAKLLKMNGTNFVNATGFDDPSHYTTPYDMAIIGRRLIIDYPEILNYSSLTESYIRENTDKPFWLVNTNKLLGDLDGLDGLKTGYTRLAKYNLTSTVKRNGIRILNVVMKEDSIEKRNQDTVKLTNYAFSKLKRIHLYGKNEVIIKDYYLENCKNNRCDFYVDQSIEITLLKEENENEITVEFELDQLKYPIKKDSKVGTLMIKLPSGEVLKYNVLTSSDLEKNTFWSIFLKKIHEMIL